VEISALRKLGRYGTTINVGGEGQNLKCMRGAVLYQVLNKQVPVPVPVPVVQVPVQVPVPNLQVPVPVPVPNFQVPVPVQVLCINYRHSVTLQLHKVKVVASFIFKKEQLTNELQIQICHNRICWFWLTSSGLPGARSAISGPNF